MKNGKMNLSRSLSVIPHLLKNYLMGLATLFRQYAKAVNFTVGNPNQRKYRFQINISISADTPIINRGSTKFQIKSDKGETICSKESLSAISIPQQ